MDTLEKLFQIASDEGIIIDYTDELPKGLEGLHLHLDGIGHIISILYNVKENRDMFIEVLSEELGHYFSSVGDNLININNYRDYLKVCKCEKQALNWSVNTVISNKDLEHAFKNNCTSYYDIAQYLNVPEKLVIEKFSYLASKCNGYIKLGDYNIILSNLPIVLVYKDV